MYDGNNFVISDATKPDLPIIFASPAFLELTGYNADEIYGINCNFLQGEGTDKNTIKRISQQLLQHRTVKEVVLNYTKDTGNGRTAFWNDLCITPMFNEKNEISCFIGVQKVVSHLEALDLMEMRNSELLVNSLQKTSLTINTSFKSSRLHKLLSRTSKPVLNKEYYTNRILPQDISLLIVEDNPENAEMIAAQFRSKGFPTRTITGVNAGEKALKNVSDNPTTYNMVVSNIHMEGVDGYKLRNELLHYDIDVLLISGDKELSVDQVVKISRDLNVCFVSKPITSKEVDALYFMYLRNVKQSFDIKNSLSLNQVFLKDLPISKMVQEQERLLEGLRKTNHHLQKELFPGKPVINEGSISPRTTEKRKQWILQLQVEQLQREVGYLKEKLERSQQHIEKLSSMGKNGNKIVVENMDRIKWEGFVPSSLMEIRTPPEHINSINLLPSCLGIEITGKITIFMQNSIDRNSFVDMIDPRNDCVDWREEGVFEWTKCGNCGDKIYVSNVMKHECRKTKHK